MDGSIDVSVCSNSNVSQENIMEAIEALKTRKARPDKTRICHHLERKYGFNRDEILTTLSSLVSNGTILKVKYKDYYSYRNPNGKKSGKVITRKSCQPKSTSLQPQPTPPSATTTPTTIKSTLPESSTSLPSPPQASSSSPPLPSSLLLSDKSVSLVSCSLLSKVAVTAGQRPLIARNIVQAIKCITRSDTRSTTNGASTGQILNLLQSKRQLGKFNLVSLEKTIREELLLGTIRVLANGNYIVPDSKTGQSLKSFDNMDENGLSDTSLEYQDSNSSKNGFKCIARKKQNPPSVGEETNSTRKQDEPSVQRARPVSQRKKIKKSLGPDFLDPTDLGYGYLKDHHHAIIRETHEPKCFNCDFPLTSNKSDKHLTCVKCKAKVHRTCLLPEAETMDIDEDEWYCEKCITICCLCGLSTENEPMLTCADCENPSHLLCLKLTRDEPVTNTKEVPWLCRECRGIPEPNDYLDDPKEPYKENSRVNRLLSSESNVFVDTKRPDSTNRLLNDKSHMSNKINTSITINNNTNKNNNTNNSNNNHSVVSENLLKTIKSLSMDPDPKNWTPQDVETYIREIGFPEQAPLFKEQLIDGRSLLLLRRIDVLRGLSMKLGPALKIYAHINQLQSSDIVSTSSTSTSEQSSTKLIQI